ncbi:peroxiredoxin family protein [Devosia aquimaris]|uniref:peroxiredoxin family protein n=1 Tax=Devosia aquimaris TaxID=2866214 RepID=UPI001CD1006E|nr:peroxiredoxin-like family protein [Devosia sp. CJK-A8-3]
MTRLTEGQMAPSMETTDLFGAPVSLAALRGRKVMLSFYRYASCPLCNLRVHSMIGRHPEWVARGLSVVAVFQSSAADIAQHVGRQDAPFPIVPDPAMQHYKRYGVETSWLGFLKAGLRPGALMEAFSRGYLPAMFNGPLNRVPADFLIDENGRLVRCYYGADVGDHLPMAEIEAFVARKPALVPA